MKKILVSAAIVGAFTAGGFAGFFAGQKSERAEYVSASGLTEASGCPDGVYMFYGIKSEELDAKFAYYKKADAKNYCDFASFEKDKASGAYQVGY